MKPVVKMSQNLKVRKDSDLEYKFNFKNAVKCSPDLRDMMLRESRNTSWEKMRRRVAKDTGQNPSGTMVYYPPKNNIPLD